MTVHIADHHGVPLITPSGEIDMDSSPDLRKALMTLAKQRTAILLVDFSGVSYIDSSGIATFVECLKSVMSYGGRLKLFSMTEGIKEIFSFSRLDKVFEIYGNIDDALSR
jgi:anti-sigma B factor antagonist